MILAIFFLKSFILGGGVKELGDIFPRGWEDLASGDLEGERSVRFEDPPRELYDKFMNAKEIPFSYIDIEGNQRNLTIRIGKGTPLFRNAMQRREKIDPEAVQNILLKHIANLIPPDLVARGPIGSIKASFQEGRCAGVSLAGKNISRARAVGRGKRKIHSVTTELSYLSKPQKIQRVFDRCPKEIEVFDREDPQVKKRVMLKDIEKIEAMVEGEGFTPELQERFLKLKDIWESLTGQLEDRQNTYKKLEVLKDQVESTDLEAVLRKIDCISLEISCLKEQFSRAERGIKVLREEISQSIQEKFFIQEEFKYHRENFAERNLLHLQENQDCFTKLVEVEKDLSSLGIPCGKSDIDEMSRVLKDEASLVDEHEKLSQTCMLWMQKIDDSSEEFEKIKMHLSQNLREKQGQISHFLRILFPEDFLELSERVELAKDPLELIRFFNDVVSKHADRTRMLMEEGRCKIKERIQMRIEKGDIIRSGGFVSYRLHLSREIEKGFLEKQGIETSFQDLIQKLEREDPFFAEEMGNQMLSLTKAIDANYQVSNELLEKITGESDLSFENEVSNKVRENLDIAGQLQLEQRKLAESVQQRLFHVKDYTLQKKIEMENTLQLRQKIFMQNQELDFKFANIHEYMMKKGISDIKVQEWAKNFQMGPKAKSQLQQEIKPIGECICFQMEIIPHVERLQSGQISLENLKEIIAYVFEQKLSDLHMDSFGAKNFLMEARSLKDLMERLGKLVQDFEKRNQEEQFQLIQEKQELLIQGKLMLEKYEQERAILQERALQYAEQAKAKSEEVFQRLREVDEKDKQCKQKWKEFLEIKRFYRTEKVDKEIQDFDRIAGNVQLIKDAVLSLHFLEEDIFRGDLFYGEDLGHAQEVLILRFQEGPHKDYMKGDFQGHLRKAQSFPDLMQRFKDIVEYEQRENLKDLEENFLHKKALLEKVFKELGL